MSYARTFTVDAELNKYFQTWVYGGQEYTI